MRGKTIYGHLSALVNTKTNTKLNHTLITFILIFHNIYRLYVNFKFKSKSYLIKVLTYSALKAVGNFPDFQFVRSMVPTLDGIHAIRGFGVSLLAATQHWIQFKRRFNALTSRQVLMKRILCSTHTTITINKSLIVESFNRLCIR